MIFDIVSDLFDVVDDALGARGRYRTREDLRQESQHNRRLSEQIEANYRESQKRYHEQKNHTSALERKLIVSEAQKDVLYTIIYLQKEASEILVNMLTIASYDMVNDYIDIISGINEAFELLGRKSDLIELPYTDLINILNIAEQNSNLQSNESAVNRIKIDLKILNEAQRNNQIEILELFKNQTLPSIISKLEYLTRSENLSNEFLEEIIKIADGEIRNQVIQSIEIPELVLNKLATDRNLEIRISIASLDVSQKSPEYQELYISALDVLSRDKSDKVRMLVTNHFYTSFSTLMRLCEDPSFDIQKNVYQRLISIIQKDIEFIELFDLKTLKVMLKFADSLIVIANKDSLNKSFKTLTENDLQLLMNILTKQIDSKICSCTDIKDILKNSSKFIRASIASVVNLPEAILIDLSKDKEEIVRKSLLSNPSLKGEALKNLATDNSRIIRTNVIYHPNFSASLLFDLFIVETREAIEFTKRTYGELQKLYKQYKK
jgi:hypothetical protein